MLDLLGTVLTGGATGILGTVLGKVFSFTDFWIEEKKQKSEHARTIEMHRLQAELQAEESERELAIAEAQTASDLRMASYSHDMTSKSSRWVNDCLRLVRPILTGGLIVLVGVIYFQSDDIGQQETIIHSVIYMSSSAVLWWFGDRALRSK